jgi:maleate isomerase
MAYTSWRGTLGLVKPTRDPGSLEELVRMLPEGIGVIPTLLDVRTGTKKEFTEAFAAYEPQVRELAEQKVDVIHPGGTAPFMLLGYERERREVAAWEKKYKTPMFTAGQNHIRALRAMKVKRFVNISATTWDDSDLVKSYFAGAGLTSLERAVFPVDFQRIGSASQQEVYAFIKKSFLAQKRCDGIYIQGGQWRVLDILEILEQDLGVPVVHAGVAKAWETMLRLHVRQPMKGYGALLAEMPKG